MAVRERRGRLGERHVAMRLQQIDGRRRGREHHPGVVVVEIRMSGLGLERHDGEHTIHERPPT
jgi:hypothetical protein